jgi:hypothetical protein
MSGCGSPKYLDGGTFENSRIVNPEILGGSASGLELTNPTLAGAVGFGPGTLDSLADMLRPLMDIPVYNDTLGNPLASGVRLASSDELAAATAPEKVAATFRDCGGTDLVPDAKLATCENLETYVAEHVNPDAILSNLKSGGGLGLVSGTRVPTYDEMTAAVALATEPSKVAATFKNDEGNPLSPGTQLLGKEQVETLIRLAVCEGCGDGSDSGTGGMAVTAFQFDANRTTLTLTESDGKSTVSWPVDFTAYAKQPTLAVTVPTTTQNPVIPETMFGSRSVVLGGPEYFVTMRVGGLRLLVPAYVDPTF